MAIRLRPTGRAALGACALLVLLLVGLRFASGRAPSAPGAGALPVLRLDFREQPLASLLDRSSGDESRDSIPVLVTADARQPQPAKASRRGFSAWHHGTAKPSLRLKQKEAAPGRPPVPEFVELSRPEDPLALCNWLPDQLAAHLGLLHERSRPVQLWLDGRDAGVYLRSLRPGDDLAAASGRLRGTFWKGDSLGERRHLDLWSSRHAWRSSGAAEPRATRALDELLAALQVPPTAAAWERLAAVFDLEAAARAAAVATLVGSIHADRAHNHVLFFDPASDRLEPLLWDANGFGIHAEPTLPVEVARHPLAERLQCDPRFVHRRNEHVWALLAGPGSPSALAATADGHLQSLAAALRSDPEIIRLSLQRGVFTAQPLAAAEVPAARDQFVGFVRARHACLLEHFQGALVAIEPDPEAAAGALVTVFGTVAVQLVRRDGQPVRSVDGREAALVWPGLSAALLPAPQHLAADGHGVAAPHPRPAPLTYRIAASPGELEVRNPFTGEAVLATTRAPSPEPLRSIHPWDHGPAAPAVVVLGPGPVAITADLRVDAGTTLRIEAGTTLVLHEGKGIRCRGAVVARGTAAAPITIRSLGAPSGGFACIGSTSVHLRHVHFVETAAWSGAPSTPPPALALRGCQSATLDACRFERAGGDAIVVAGGAAVLQDCRVQLCAGTGLLVVGAEVLAAGCELAFAQIGCVGRDGAVVHLRGGSLHGNVRGAVADRSARGWAGGRLHLEAVACRDNGQCDVDADGFGSVELAGTLAKAGPLAGAQVQEVAGPAPPSAR